MHYVLIFIGGGLGAITRAWLSVQIAARWQSQMPWPTIIVNVTGCFIIGLLAAVFGVGRYQINDGTRQFIMVGLLGGYTTFSSFSLETLLLVRQGYWFAACGNVLLSLCLCLVAVGAGYALGNISSVLR